MHSAVQFAVQDRVRLVAPHALVGVLLLHVWRSVVVLLWLTVSIAALVGLLGIHVGAHQEILRAYLLLLLVY